MKKTRTGYETLAATVAEMKDTVETGDGIDIPIDTSKVQGILERDKSPRFVTIQVARETVSGNKRRYSAALIDSIAEQINRHNPIGGAGHIPEGAEGHAFPPTETVWLGATVKEIDGKKVCYAKGYILPSAAERRNYLELAKDLGKNVAVSIWGKAKEAVYDAKDKVYDIRGLNLQRIDWVPPGTEGIPNDGTLILASEMVSPKKGNQRKDNKMEREDVIKDLKIGEMQEHNPKLVEEIQGGAAAVSEMKTVRAKLGIKEDADAAQTIGEMQAKIRDHELTDEINSRVQAPQARPIIKQLAIGAMAKSENAGKTVAEMIVKVLDSDDAKAIIKDKSGAPNVSPNNDGKRQAKARRFTKN